MVINFLVNPVVNGWEPTDTRLGGTEESVVRWAEELVSRGHKVTIFYNRRSDDKSVYESFENPGLYYAPREHYQSAKHDPSSFWDTHYADVCINIKSSEVKPIEGERMLYLTNETDANRLDLSAYEAVIWPSEWADENIPVNNPQRYILPHGYDSDKIKPGKKISKQVLYASSPDRGLDLLLACWPSVYEAHPDANLIVTYGAPAQDIPGVTFLGEVDEDMMNELYATSDVWAHPCSGGELYGITGIKAQASGCVPVYIPTMALSETVKHGVICDEFNFRDKLIQTLGDEELKANIREQLSKEDFVDWKKSTTILENIIGVK